MNFWLKIFATPLIPIAFAYLELGGNWFGLRLLQRGPTIWSVGGTIIFSVLYSLVAAFVSLKLGFNLALLMVMYGFGFSIVSIFLILQWGKLPSFSVDLIRTYHMLWVVGIIALIGFLISAYLVIVSK